MVFLGYFAPDARGLLLDLRVAASAAAPSTKSAELMGSGVTLTLTPAVVAPSVSQIPPPQDE